MYNEFSGPLCNEVEDQDDSLVVFRKYINNMTASERSRNDMFMTAVTVIELVEFILEESRVCPYRRCYSDILCKVHE